MFGLIVINQYEKGVKFTLGRYKGILQPGLHFYIPIIQVIETVDIRQRTIDLQSQSVMTKDQVNITIDGVVFYTIEEPEKTILNVANLRKQLEDKATSELKEIIGNKTIQESLSQREVIAKELIKKLKDAVKDATSDRRKDWGVEIKAVQINNVLLPQELVRAMSKQAEAAREREARVTKASGEKEASKIFAEASQEYKNNPEALKLRELQTYQEIGTERNSLMIVIPSGMANPLGNFVLPMGVQELSRSKEKVKKKR